MFGELDLRTSQLQTCHWQTTGRVKAKEREQKGKERVKTTHWDQTERVIAQCIT